MAKQQSKQSIDRSFLSRMMKCDKRNDNIYSEWANWCANSDDKYYIDSKNGYFYTRVHTQEEINKERKKREILKMLFIQNRNIGTKEEWEEYEKYIYEHIKDEYIMNFTPMYFTEWKASKNFEG